MEHYTNLYINPEKLPEIRKRNLKKFRQILDDLTDIYNRFEAGELDGIWFIRRLNAAILGCSWMTENGKRYCISWKDGKLIKRRDEPPTLDLRGAYQRMRLSEQRLSGCDPINGSLPFNVTVRGFSQEDGVA